MALTIQYRPLVKNLEKIILTNDVWGEVVIDDKVTISNIEYFISKLHTSKLEPSELLLESAIRAQLIYQDCQKELYVSKDWVYQGDLVYEGIDTNSIYNILKKFMYSSIQLSEIVNNSSLVSLSSKDTKTTYQVVNKPKIVQSFAASTKVSGDLEETQRLPPEYPFYCINVTFPNNKKLEITLITPDYFLVNDYEKLHVYSNGRELWDFCVATLGKPDPKHNQICYLFQANSITASKWDWDLQSRKNYIVRALLQGEQIKKKPMNLKDHYEMVFHVNGQEESIYIYENYFFFKGNFYYLLDAKGILERIVLAN